MIDYLLKYQDATAALAGVGQYYNHPDLSIVVSVSVSGSVLTGYFILISLPIILPSLVTNPATQIVIDRCKAGIGAPDSVVKSLLPMAAIGALSITPVFAGSDYGKTETDPRSAYSRLSFFDDFTALSTIDVNASGAAGFSWYSQQWFGSNVTSSGAISVSGSVLTLSGILQTAFSPSPGQFTGTVFGGGAYFEASIAFDPAKGALASSGSWPAFWSLAVEHINGTEQWPGQPIGYAHFTELDFFEAFHAPNESYVGKTSYWGTIHDWSGIYNSGFPFNIQNGNHQFSVGSVDWSVFHKYGCLWVPSANGKPGYVRWFFDDIPGPMIFWLGPPTNPTGINGLLTPSRLEDATQNYSVIDQQHLAVRLETDPSWPMMVDWVKVWQAS